MHPKSWLVASLILLVASGAMLAGSVLLQSDRGEAERHGRGLDPARVASDRNVAAALDRLAHEIAELRLAVARGPAARRELEQDADAASAASARALDDRAPASAGSIAGSERTEFDELVRALQRACARPGGESIAEAAAHAPARPADLFERLGTESDEDRTHRFRLSGYHDVLAACGAPDAVVASPQGELLWTYEDPGSERKLWFSFVDGLVVRVFG